VLTVLLSGCVLVLLYYSVVCSCAVERLRCCLQCSGSVVMLFCGCVVVWLCACVIVSLCVLAVVCLCCCVIA